MLWQDNKGLHQLPLSFRFALTAFLCVCGMGYLLGVANVWFSYVPVDQKPGLSIDDIRLSFHGDPSGSKMEKALYGSMKQYMSSDADTEAIITWIKAGGKESAFDSIQPIISGSCDMCHSAEVATAGIITSTYKDIAPLLETDTGKSISRLVGLSHTHVNALLPLMFCLSIVFSFTRYSNRLKGVIMVFSFASFVLDVGSWWLAKVWGQAAILVIFGGASLGIAYVFLLLLPLYEIWFVKVPDTANPLRRVSDQTP
jgi:hypothetical protein